MSGFVKTFRLLMTVNAPLFVRSTGIHLEQVDGSFNFSAQPAPRKQRGSQQQRNGHGQLNSVTRCNVLSYLLSHSRTPIPEVPLSSLFVTRIHQFPLSRCFISGDFLSGIASLDRLRFRTPAT